MKIAIIHYWFVGMRGGEKVVEELCNVYPDAHIYTHVVDKKQLSDVLKEKEIRTTFISRLPLAKKLYKFYLPLMPLALEQLDLSDYDLVISSESGPAKGVITDPDALHICYCHSPMRYLWDMHKTYSQGTGFLKRLLMAPLLHYLRVWDVTSSSRVDFFIANSNFISRRISKFFRRPSVVIHPPVAVDDFFISGEQGDYYLMVGQLVGYKKVDLAIDAFNSLGRRLIIIGQGEEYDNLEKKASENIEFLGRQSFNMIKKYYSECRALIFPGVEDFGMVPIEAMASGRPVIAFCKGGALDYVIDEETGLFFLEQTKESLIEAVNRFEQMESDFSPSNIKAYAEKFNRISFTTSLQTFIDSKLNRL